MAEKLIIDAHQHNCPQCGTKSANYSNILFEKIDETDAKALYAMFVTCCVCGKRSMHLLKNMPLDNTSCIVKGTDYYNAYVFAGNERDLDATEIDKISDNIIMSIPTPTFLIDAAIPNKLRDLLIEAQKCVKENAMTGASACIRKAIYEFLIMEKATGSNYDDKIKSIKNNWPQITDYLDILKGIKGITSDQVHEESFTKFKSEEARMYIAILEEIFCEVYVIPLARNAKKQKILKKFAVADKAKKAQTKPEES